MYEALIALFVSSATFFGNPTMPPASDQGRWQTTQKWQDGLTFKAKIPVADLNCDKESLIQLPMVQYGVQKVWIGNFSRSFNTGDQPKNVYSRPVLRCDVLAGHSEGWVHWEISAYSKYYAKVLSWPQVVKIKDSYRISELFYVGSTFALFTLALFIFVSFSSTSNRFMVNTISISAVLFSFYFMLTAGEEFGIRLSFLLAHKVADLFLIGGIFFLACAYGKIGFISRKFIALLFATSVISIILLLPGKNGDQVQFGTTISYMIGLIGFLPVTYRSFSRFKNDNELSSFAIFSCTIVILFGFVMEAAIVGGSIESMSYFPLFTLISYTCFAIAINQGIRLTYKERDQLVNHMDSMIRERTAELHKALEEKDYAQAELIQKEKLASLGTLSAGIAHEINNSINYVNSCVIGLERILPTVLPPEDKRLAKINKLIETARHGCRVTMDIVTSLRNFTGLNQAKFKTAKFDELINSVLTIVRSKVGNVKITKEYDESLDINCSLVGMNQVLMNLITNAVDAVDPANGEIKISATKNDHSFLIQISDNGSGISQDKINNIFDPFFTTKEVGKGTGLGLHIVHNEIINKHKGKIDVDSTPGDGTVFTIEIPEDAETQQLAS